MKKTILTIAILSILTSCQKSLKVYEEGHLVTEIHHFDSLEHTIQKAHYTITYQKIDENLKGSVVLNSGAKGTFDMKNVKIEIDKEAVTVSGGSF